MTSSTHSRRRRPSLSGIAGTVLALSLLGIGYASMAPASADATTSTTSMVTTGRTLFLTGCSTCHGLNAQGTNLAPSLIGVGSAAVDFQVSTGRMPLQQTGPEAQPKATRYSQAQVDALAAYVASLAPGPASPSSGALDLSGANVALGGELFRTNCAQCHNFNGSGGALTYGKYAPSLYPATPKQIWEAMLTGPENMPVFSDAQITPDQKRDILAFIQATHAQADPGGMNLGRIGPVPEGLVGWLGGVGLCVLGTLWIGSRLGAAGRQGAKA